MVNYCKYCGKQLKEGEACGCTSIHSEQRAETITNRIANTSEVSTSAHPLSGKTFQFISSTFVCFTLLTRGRIFCNITAEEDKLNIDMSPKRKNKIPEIYYSDIVGTVISYKMPINYIIMLAIISIYCFVIPAAIVVVPIFIWLGSNWRITLYLRNGSTTDIYSGSKKDAEEFVTLLGSKN